MIIKTLEEAIEVVKDVRSEMEEVKRNDATRRVY